MKYLQQKGLVKYVGVMLIGKMEILTDQETRNMIWKTGVTDPDYCVLKFTAARGRYYSRLSLIGKKKIKFIYENSKLVISFLLFYMYRY